MMKRKFSNYETLISVKHDDTPNEIAQYANNISECKLNKEMIL